MGSTPFFNSLSDNINFDIIVECLVLCGILLTRFVKFNSKKRKEAFLKLTLLISIMIFFNLAFIIDVFNISSMIMFGFMGVSILLSVALIIIFLTKYKGKVRKASNIVLLITIIVGVPFYIFETLTGFNHHFLSDIIECVLMLSVLICVYDMIIFFIRREEKQTEKK
jgi:hypothetical protein